MNETSAIEILLETPNGPVVEYDGGESADGVEAAIPPGWAVSWETPAYRLASGRLRSPLVRRSPVALVKVFQRDEWSLYGLWRLTDIEGHASSVEVGCVVGVPESLRGTAMAAASDRGLLDAWYADSSDWSDESERDAALAVLREHVAALCAEHGVTG